jgi:hypothetical protein
VKERLKVLALLVVCVGVPIIAWDLTRIVRGEPDLNIPNPTYAELVAIVLTAVTVVLATLAIVIAILAVWGYKSIKDEAGFVAERAVKSTVEEAVKAHLSAEAMEKHVAREVRRRMEEILGDRSLYARAFDAQGDIPQQQRAVAEGYPKDEGNDEGPAGK